MRAKLSCSDGPRTKGKLVAASRRAIPRPIPREDPVTRATLSLLTEVMLNSGAEKSVAGTKGIFVVSDCVAVGVREEREEEIE